MHNEVGTCAEILPNIAVRFSCLRNPSTFYFRRPTFLLILIFRCKLRFFKFLCVLKSRHVSSFIPIESVHPNSGNC